MSKPSYSFKVTGIVSDKPMKVVFEPGFVNEHNRDPSFGKDVDTARKYGFRGFSRGGVNGIFRITKRDKSLSDWYNHYSSSRQFQEISERYGLKRDSLYPVKIVSHKPHGERVVGVMDTSARLIVFMDEVAYRK